MLKAMMWQAALAALMIGGAAAAYAQARGNGYLAAPQETTRTVKPERGAQRDMEKGSDRHEQRPARREGRHHD